MNIITFSDIRSHWVIGYLAPKNRNEAAGGTVFNHQSNMVLASGRWNFFLVSSYFNPYCFQGQDLFITFFNCFQCCTRIVSAHNLWPVKSRKVVHLSVTFWRYQDITAVRRYVLTE